MSHRADGSEPVDPDSFAYGDDIAWRRVLARILLVAGRILLVLGPAVFVTCRLTEPVWANAPSNGPVPHHVIPEGTMVMAFLFAGFLPLLILPIGSMALTTVTESELRVETVLGTRRVSVPLTRQTWYSLGDGSARTRFVVVRDARWRHAIISSSDAWTSGVRLGSLGGLDYADTSRTRMVLTGIWTLTAPWLALIIHAFAIIVVAAVIMLLAIGR